MFQKLARKKDKLSLYELDQDLEAEVRGMCESEMINAIQVQEKHAREDAINEVKNKVLAKFEEQEATDEDIKQVKKILDKIVKGEVRRLITVEKIRPDGRKIDEIRPLSSQIGILPRTHGSGLFTRGQTQALSICTLGAMGDVQILDGFRN